MEIKRHKQPIMFEHMVKVNNNRHAGNHQELHEWMQKHCGEENQSWSLHKIFSSKTGTECVATFKNEKQLTLFLLRWQQDGILAQIPSGPLASHWRLVVKNQYW